MDARRCGRDIVNPGSAVPDGLHDVSHENLHELLTDAPFRPFKVCATGGKECSVAHPEFAILSRSQIVIVDPTTERVSIIGLGQISSVEIAQAA